MSAPKELSRLQIILHWAVALLVILQIIWHKGIEGAWQAVEKGGEMVFSPTVITHIAAGGIVFALVVWRIIIRLRRGTPEFPKAESKIQSLAAKAVHGMLYILLILLPFSGMAAVFGGVLPAAGGHSLMGKVLIILVLVHIAATIFHQFILKTNLIARMKL